MIDSCGPVQAPKPHGRHDLSTSLKDPSLPQTMQRITLERLKVQASVGVLEHELRSRQPLVITIIVDLGERPLVPPTDGVEHVFDYRALRDTALAEAQAGHVNMIETLGGRIAQRLLEHKVIQRVIVRILKPNVFPDCDGASVEIDHIRSSMP